MGGARRTQHRTLIGSRAALSDGEPWSPYAPRRGAVRDASELLHRADSCDTVAPGGHTFGTLLAHCEQRRVATVLDPATKRMSVQETTVRKLGQQAGRHVRTRASWTNQMGGLQPTLASALHLQEINVDSAGPLPTGVSQATFPALRAGVVAGRKKSCWVL